MRWESEYFFGNKVSNYGLENKRIDYGTLAKAFPHILNNELINATGRDNWELENGDLYDDDFEAGYDDPKEIYQYFIINDNGAEILKDYTDEIVFYNAELDIYLWGVTHYGTAWDYVLTDIELS